MATAELGAAPSSSPRPTRPNGVIAGTSTTDLPRLFAHDDSFHAGEGAGLAGAPAATGGDDAGVLPHRAGGALPPGADRGAAGGGGGAPRAGDCGRGVAGDTRAPVAARGLGFRLRDLSPAVLAARIETEPGRADAVRAALLPRSAVAGVRADAYASLAAARTPDDALWPAQQWHYGMVDLPRAWGITTGSAQVLVAVVDDGIRFGHPDLAANLTGDGYDFVSPSTAPLCGGGTADLTGDGDGYDPDPTIPIVYRRTGACVREALWAGTGCTWRGRSAAWAATARGWRG